MKIASFQGSIMGIDPDIPCCDERPLPRRAPRGGVPDG